MTINYHMLVFCCCCPTYKSHFHNLGLLLQQHCFIEIMSGSFMKPWINGAAHFNIRTTLSCLLALLCRHALVINDNNMSCLLLGNTSFEHNPLDFILYIIMYLSIFALLSPFGDGKILHLLLFLDAMSWPFLVTRRFCICSILAFFEFVFLLLDAMSSSWLELAISYFQCHAISRHFLLRQQGLSLSYIMKM